jgi:hypothetical protein
MKSLRVAALLLFLCGVVHAAESDLPKAQALCLKSDKVDWWEKQYCQVLSGADDYEAEVFKKCMTKYKADTSVPRQRCKKIIWLKEKTCDLWKLSKPFARTRCLQSPKFRDEVESNYEEYHGG